MRLETSRDLARSRAFYAGKLGFHVVDERGGQWFMVDAGVSVEGPKEGRAELTDPDGHPIVLIQS